MPGKNYCPGHRSILTCCFRFVRYLRAGRGIHQGNTVKTKEGEDMAKKISLFSIWLILGFALPAIASFLVQQWTQDSWAWFNYVLVYGGLLGLVLGGIFAYNWLQKRKAGFASKLLALTIVLVIIPLSVFGTCVSGVLSNLLRSSFFK
jgi:hypothetical protein